MPDALSNAPKVPQSSEDIWRAWGYLNKSRTPTMGDIANIPVSQILSYVQYHYIHDYEDRYRLEYLIGAMDDASVELCRSKDQKNSGQDIGEYCGSTEIEECRKMFGDTLAVQCSTCPG